MSGIFQESDLTYRNKALFCVMLEDVRIFGVKIRCVCDKDDLPHEVKN